MWLRNDHRTTTTGKKGRAFSSRRNIRKFGQTGEVKEFHTKTSLRGLRICSQKKVETIEMEL